MAEIKWIKIVTNIFDNRKIKQIETLPEGDTIIVIWFKLLCLSGQLNDNGYIYLTQEVPYTEEMLSTEFNRPLKTIQLAMRTFQTFGMIEIIDDIYRISNWENYQNVEGMERVREQTRKRMQDYRARKRLGVVSTGEQCVYCGKNANTVDHIIPRSKGGQDEADNLVPCCKSCNSSKKDKDLADFLNDSFCYTYQEVNHELVRKNNKLMKYVRWNGNSYVTVTQSYDIDKDIDIEIDNNIYNVENDIPKEDGNSLKDIKKEIIDYLNQKIGSTYKPNTKATAQAINARLKEGFKLEDFKKVIDNQYDKWFGTEWEQYLRPQTLFGTKFENYLNTPVKSKDSKTEKQDEDVYEILDISEEEYWNNRR